jgi:HEAT repeat protein
MTLQEAAAEADALAQAGSERELADLRAAWGDELEDAARSSDFRARAVAFRAIGQFRWRQKEELLRRGLDDESPAARGSALISLELLSRDHPSTINSVRSLLHNLATVDGNAAVRRLAIVCLRNGSPQRETIVLLDGLAEDDEAEPELRAAAAKVAQTLRRKPQPQKKK